MRAGEEVTGYTDILYDVAGNAATISINRPKTLNAFTAHTISEMSDALRRAEGDREVGVVVLTGVGSKAFSSGGDAAWEAAGGVDGFDWTLGRQVAELRKPVIARVNGYAIAGGNHLAYFCDFTIAAEHSIFGQNGARIASPAGGHCVAHLASIVGHKRAREMWMLCRRYTARQAYEWGLVNAVVPEAELDAEVRRWCDELLALSPTVLRTLKASFRTHMESYIEHNVSDILESVNPGFFASGEQKEGVDAFIEKRKPDFSPWR
jgi:2-ketocyclohexanecarboxyl-CoA hydrolase